MIINTPFKEDAPEGNTLQALYFLRLHFDLIFYPCGSRFFGDSEPESDYDFFIKDSADTREELLKGGFEHRKFDYPDHNSVCVLSLGEVHVITVHSVKARLIAQQYIIHNKLERPKQDSHWWCKLYEELRDKGLIEQWWDLDIDDQGKDQPLESDFEWKPN